MPKRYATKSRHRSWVDEDGDVWPDGPMSITVVTETVEPQPTGLFNKNGDELVAVNEPNPIGFFAKIED